MATLRDLTDPANRPAAIDSLVGVGETFRRIENRARELGGGIERAEGTAGRALKDSALRLSAERTRAEHDECQIHVTRLAHADCDRQRIAADSPVGGGDTIEVRTSGGEENRAKIRFRALNAGGFQISAKVNGPAAILPRI